MKKSLKIAQVVCVFPPYAGGIGTAAANISKYLVKSGHKVTVFTPAYKKDYKRHEHVDGYSVERLQATIKYGNAALMMQLSKKLKDFDIVHLHLPFIGSAEILLLLKKTMGEKLHLVCHYHMDLFGRNRLIKTIFSFEQNILIPKEIMASDKVIVSSLDYIKNSKLGGLFKSHRDKFEIIPYGIDTNLFYPAKKDEDLVDKYGLRNKKVIVFVGGLDDAHYFKGVDKLLKAFSELPNSNKYKLIIVGKGNLLEGYKKMAEELGIAKMVIFTGFVSDDDLPKIYNIADISTLPSINSAEAFGIVLLEAMACGKPTVASYLPGVREVSGSVQKAISPKPGNYKDLMKKLDLILRDHELYNKISQINLLRVKNEFSWEVISEKINSVYEGVINNDL